MGIELSAVEERQFEDGEHKSLPLVNVRGRGVFVIHSLYSGQRGSNNDKLIRLFFIGTLKDAGAAEVTAVVPMLCYARKDQKSQARDPVTTRYVAQLFEAVGVDRVVAIDVHNIAAFQNASRCNSVHLEATGLFTGEADTIIGASPIEHITVTNTVPAFRLKSAPTLAKLVKLDASALRAKVNLGQAATCRLIPVVFTPDRDTRSFYCAT